MAREAPVSALVTRDGRHALGRDQHEILASRAKAFEIKRDGDADVLSLPGIPGGHPATTYRITVRK